MCSHVCEMLRLIFHLLTFLILFTDRALDHGMPDHEALFLLSVIGFGNIFLRCIIGISVTFFPNIDATNATTYSLMIAGVATIITAFYPDHPFYLQAIYCIFFSVGNGKINDGQCLFIFLLLNFPFHFPLACVVALRSIMYVNILGIERLTNAFGLLSSMCGIGIIIGIPALGALKTLSGDYCLTFIGSGLLMLTAGVVFRLLPLVKQKEERKLEQNQLLHDEVNKI